MIAGAMARSFDTAPASAAGSFAMAGSDPAGFDVLRSLLDTAHDLVTKLNDEPLFARLVDVFSRMPADDREAIVGVLEREVETRLLSLEVAESMTRIALHPNPNARLYVRVVGQENTDEVETLAFLRAAYSVQRSVDALDPDWRAMVLLGLRYMEPAARQRIDDFNRSMRDLLDEAARSPEPAPPEEPVPERERR
jgi:hypothetical protein